MPTEYRFDDLDLREEPATGSAGQVGADCSGRDTCWGASYSRNNCTDACCL